LRGTFSKNLVGIRRVESNRKRRLEVELRAPKCNDSLERANSRAAAHTRVIIRACDMCNKVYARLRDDKTFPSVSRNRPTQIAACVTLPRKINGRALLAG